MVQHHFDDDADTPLVRGVQECLEVIEGPVCGIYGTIVGNIVTIVAQRGRKKRHEPDGIDTEFLQVIEFLRQSAKVAITIAGAVIKSSNVDLIDNCVLVPKRVLQSQSSVPEVSWLSGLVFWPVSVSRTHLSASSKQR